MTTTKTRHELIARMIELRAEGKVTDVEMVGELAAIVTRTECGCLECTE